MWIRHSVQLGVVVVIAGWAAVTEAQVAVPPSGFFADNIVTEPAPLHFTAAPVLNNSTASGNNAGSVLALAATAGKPPTLMILEALSNPGALVVFDEHAVRFVFTGFVDAARVGKSRAIADQVLSSAESASAFLGNFDFYPNSGIDTTRPVNRPANPSSNFQEARGLLEGTYGNQIAMPALLPGSPDFKNPAAGNSGAPNIRSALFTLPIQRLTLAELGLRGYSDVPVGSAAYAIAGVPNASSTRLIPWVSRFNNWDNSSLGGELGGGGFVQNNATPANGQLLSRGDFSAQILHYRLRGADSVALACSEDTGVIGYSAVQARQDVVAGWTASSVADGIFGRGSYTFANLNNGIGDQNSNSGDVNPRNTQLSGAVWSGVYDRAGSADPISGRRKLVILLSNLGAVQRIVDLPNNIGGFSTFKPPGVTDFDRFDDFQIDPGAHRLLEFSLQQSSRGRLEWVFQGDAFPFPDNNRNGIGIGFEFPLKPGPEVTITADALVCSATSGNIAKVATVAGYTYAWTVTGGALESGQGTSEIVYTAAAGSTVTLGVTVTDPSSGNFRTRSKTVNIIVAPVSSISGRTSTCALQEENLYSSLATPGAPHLWTITGDGAIVGPNDGETVRVTAGAAGTFTLHDSILLGGGCQTSSELEVSITPPLTPPDIQANPNPIPADTGASAATSVIGYDYLWEIQNGIIQGSATQPNVTYTAGSYGNVILKLTIFGGADLCRASSMMMIPIDAPNQNPVANPDQLARRRGQGLTYAAARLLDNDTDREETPLIVTDVAQPLRGSVVFDGENIIYTPDPGGNANDLLEYSISDGAGGTATSLVYISVAPELTIVRVPGGVKLKVLGAAETLYVLQRTLSLEEPWQGLTVLSTDADGRAEFTQDGSSDPLPPTIQAFYRLAQ